MSSTTTRTEWDAIWDYAGITAPAAIGTPNEVKGRSLATQVDSLMEFWTKHQATITPFLTQLAIAALNALLAAQGDIQTIDPPGPA